MLLTIDRWGRLTLPKAIRDAAGISAGVEFRATASGHILVENVAGAVPSVRPGKRPIKVSRRRRPP